MKINDLLKKYTLFSLSPLLSAFIQLASIFLLGHSLSGPELGIAGIYNTIVFILVFISDGGSSSYFIYRKFLPKYDVNLINIFNVAISAFAIIIIGYYVPEKSDLLGLIVVSLTVTLPLYNYARLLVEKKYNIIAIVELKSKLLFFITLYIAINEFDYQGSAVVMSWAVSYFLRYCLFWWFSKKIELYKNDNLPQNKPAAILKSWWMYIHNQILSQVLNYFTITFDIFIISHFGGLEKVGVYSLCKDATLKISAVLSPVISKLLISHVVNIEENKISPMYKKVYKATIIISISVFGIWALCGSSIIHFIRPQLDQGILTFIIGWSICGILRMMINPIVSIFQATGKTRNELYVNITSAVSFIFFMGMLSIYFDNIADAVILALICMYSISFVYATVL
ncbi:O22 family O-antigen flippase, partial [Escherichia coli]|nr:O22 family O-antigen flippase [Escherichia coli]